MHKKVIRNTTNDMRMDEHCEFLNSLFDSELADFTSAKKIMMNQLKDRFPNKNKMISVEERTFLIDSLATLVDFVAFEHGVKERAKEIMQR